MITIDRLKKARIQIQKSNPFFAYLSLFLKFKEDNKMTKTASIDSKGEFCYNEEFFEKLSDDEVEVVIIHEILHLSFLHLLRRKEREHKLWNCACDIAVNQIIKDNGFYLPNDCLVSGYNNVFEYNKDGLNIRIEDCDKKTSEEIFEELDKQNKKQNKGNKSNGKGDGEGIKGLEKGRFDKHIEGKQKSPEEIRKAEKEWNDRTREAIVSAKMKGNLPNGIQRMFDKIHEEKIDWRSLLNRFITQQIPYNYTYAKPHKKSICIGEYMPDVLKEKIDITIGIDVSGSCGKEELNDFLSEIIGMAKAYQEKINMRLLTHEVDVVDDWLVKNGNIEKIKNLKIRGGGGTSHLPIYEFIRENVRDCKCAIFFTDGYSDINDVDFGKNGFESLFVITKNGTEEQVKEKEFIKLE